MTNLHFDLPKEQSSIIKVIGVGGGGSNAVNHMYSQGITGVNFVICNTDNQALEVSPIPNQIQLGPEITEGLGAGSNPEVGRMASEESAEEIIEILSKNTKMCFVTAGMGGGTGTGGAPVIAKIAKEMGILTVGIVTTPFSFEGRRKLKQAEEGIQRLRENVDTLLIISNDRIREIYGNLTRSEAFANADDILTMAAKSISEIITVPGEINVDFADVEYVMKDSGVAIMGSCVAEGEERALRAIQGALNSPLLNDSDIRGAKHILLNISSGHKQVLIDEITEINDFVQEAAGNDTDIIFGTCDDESLGDKLSVTVIATGFEGKKGGLQKDEKKVVSLNQPKPTNQLFNEKKEEQESQQQEWQMSSNMEESHEEAEEEQESNAYDFQLKRIEPQKEEKDEDDLSFYTTKRKMTEDDKKEMEDTHEDRKRILRDLSYKWTKSGNISELENEPAYKRKGIELNKVQHSSESSVSKFTLNNSDVDGEKRPEIKKNNSFLHDNVD